MKNYSQREVVRDFLSFGLLPNEQNALQYFEGLYSYFENQKTEIQSADGSTLLKKILRNRVLSGEYSEVIVPLTAGFDSRALLCAARSVFGNDSVYCATVGEVNGVETKMAERICEKLNLSWRRIDPDSVDWSLERLVQNASSSTLEGPALANPYWVTLFAEINREASENTAILSGYLGDMTSGAHLRAADETNRGNRVYFADRFVQRNSTNLFDFTGDRERWRQFFVRVLEKADEIGELGHFTDYDVLDLCFRQYLRIRAGTVGPFKNCIAPFSAPEWIIFWSRKRFLNRYRQLDYKTMLKTSGPEVFADLKDADLKDQLINYVILRGKQVEPLRDLWREVKGFVRGAKGQSVGGFAVDFHRRLSNNTGLTNAVKSFAKSFDSRDVVLEWSAEQEYEKFLRAPSTVGWDRMRWVTAAECHIRAGNFAGTDEYGV